MIRRSGVRPAVAASKAARETPRRSASGHSPARQLPKLAAAARIASAVIVGWPDEPDSPLHSGAALAGAGTAGGVTVPVLWLGVNSERRSKPCPSTGAGERAGGQCGGADEAHGSEKSRHDAEPQVPSSLMPSVRSIAMQRTMGTYMVAGPLTPSGRSLRFPSLRINGSSAFLPAMHLSRPQRPPVATCYTSQLRQYRDGETRALDYSPNLTKP